MRKIRILTGLVCVAVCACSGASGDEVLDDSRAIADGGDAADRDLETPAPDGTQRHIQSGTLRGFVQDGSFTFLGVPFAAPPIGDLRWRRPQPVAPWQGEREALEFSLRCTQSADSFLEPNPQPGQFFGVEDCLYLNVWTPKDVDPGERLPVVFFVHGGGNTYGGAMDPISTLVHANEGHEDEPLYGGSRLAAKAKVVVVTTNYRLGALGFISHAALDAESPTKRSGNYGLYDITAALTWVQQNIEVFQGDPQKVLLIGQSGGARDVNALATCNTPDGLFSRVAVHSAPLGLKPLGELRTQTSALFAEMGCDGADPMACMRAIPKEELVLAKASVPLGLASGAFLPTLDGELCTQQPITVISSGQYRGTPMILGTMDNEYSHRWSDITAQQYPALVGAAVGSARAAAVLQQYPLDRFDSPTVAYTEMMSDKNVSCPHRRYARAAAAAGVPLYFYRFRETLEPSARIGYGAYHTSDFLYFFQHMTGDAFPVAQDDVAAQGVMLRYWTRFAAQGTPSGGADPVWPAFTRESEHYLSVAAEPVVGQHVKQDDCDFWDQQLDI